MKIYLKCNAKFSRHSWYIIRSIHFTTTSDPTWIELLNICHAPTTCTIQFLLWTYDFSIIYVPIIQNFCICHKDYYTTFILLTPCFSCNSSHLVILIKMYYDYHFWWKANPTIMYLYLSFSRRCIWELFVWLFKL